jgi:hypothetical protein
MFPAMGQGTEKLKQLMASPRKIDKWFAGWNLLFIFVPGANKLVFYPGIDRGGNRPNTPGFADDFLFSTTFYF